MSVVQAKIDELYGEFTKRYPAAGDSFGTIDRLMYWEPGTYKLEIFVNTSRPEESFVDEWMFELTEDDVKSLRLNVVTIIHQACDRGGVFNFAYPAYEEPESD